jgi:hypothetical protein
MEWYLEGLAATGNTTLPFSRLLGLCSIVLAASVSLPSVLDLWRYSELIFVVISSIIPAWSSLLAQLQVLVRGPTCAFPKDKVNLCHRRHFSLCHGICPWGFTNCPRYHRPERRQSGMFLGFSGEHILTSTKGIWQSGMGFATDVNRFFVVTGFAITLLPY